MIIIGVLALILFTCLFRKKKPILFVTICYAAALIYFVGFYGARTGLGGVEIRVPLPCWRAIETRHYGYVTNRSVLNTLLFIPFGYLLALDASIWKKKWKMCWWKVVLAGFLTSLVIETTQLIFRFGVFELDDLIKNTLGAGIGYGCWKLTEFLLRKRSPDNG